jgi:glioma pathogenesis-related protein 2
MHGCPALQLNRPLCKFAQIWANNIASRNVMQHRSNSKYGENIYMMGAARPPVKVTGKMPVDEWYKEIKYFALGCGGLSTQTVHFTQVVWKSSKRIGVGRATNRYRSFKTKLK